MLWLVVSLAVLGMALVALLVGLALGRAASLGDRQLGRRSTTLP